MSNLIPNRERNQIKNRAVVTLYFNYTYIFFCAPAYITGALKIASERPRSKLDRITYAGVPEAKRKPDLSIEVCVCVSLYTHTDTQ
jgi:hypothetical protein